MKFSDPLMKINHKIQDTFQKIWSRKQIEEYKKLIDNFFFLVH